MKITGNLGKKIDKILALIRPHAERDIEIIKKLTGEQDVRYYDIAFLKEKIKRNEQIFWMQIFQQIEN